MYPRTGLSNSGGERFIFLNPFIIWNTSHILKVRYTAEAMMREKKKKKSGGKQTLAFLHKLILYKNKFQKQTQIIYKKFKFSFKY